jgi:hypothetical protein
MMNLSRLSLVVLLVAAFARPVLGQAKDPQADAVRKTIENHYFKAQSTGDGGHLKGTFIDEGRLMWIADGQLRMRTSGEYIAGFQGKPPANEASRKRRVVMVDVTGDAAVAKVELDYPDTRITDYFALLKVGTDWKIVHKWFHRQPKQTAGK